MLTAKELERLLFIDIETVYGHRSFSELSPILQAHWARRATRELKLTDPTPEEVETAYYDRAGIPAEFAKVVCVSLGYIILENEQPRELRLKSFYGDDEKALLTELHQLLNKEVGQYQYRFQRLCGHNIKEFDVPFLARRSVMHGLLPLPYVFQLAGKKPWEVPHVDTMELWRFGDYKSFTALELLAELLGVPTPKGDISGSDVSRVYWQEGDLPRIARYCEHDVAATMNVMLRLCGFDIITENISFSL